MVAIYHFAGVVPSLGQTWFQLVEFLTSITDINKGLRLAAQNGNFSVIEYFIGKGANDWNLGMKGAFWQLLPGQGL